MELTLCHLTIEEADADLIAMRVFASELQQQGDPRHVDYSKRVNALWVLIEEARAAGDAKVDIPNHLLA
ncbi:MAG TPA: hypothetical protein VND94_15435 [Terriglobia bacterium]|nr:hypothetical protein [Terriglobia bacterium]